MATAENGTPTLPSFEDISGKWHEAARNVQTYRRLLTTDAPIALTPKTPIWKLNKATLYHYTPVVPEEQRKKKTPLLLVFAIMNRPYVLDLRPGHSFVEYMLNKGHEVYLLDWGIPGPENKNMKIDDYALEYLPRVVRKLKSHTGAEQFSMLGWCLGALISTIYACAQADQGLKNLVLLTAPLDFDEPDSGLFTKWTRSPSYNADRIVDTFGNVPGEMIDAGAKMLKPFENYIGNYVHLWDNIEDEGRINAWHSMNTWVRDIIPMAGESYRQLINEFYKKNSLMEGTLVMKGQRIELEKLTASVLNVIAQHDHITPPCQSEKVMDHLGTEDKELFHVKGGHIGIMAGRGAEKNTWPHIDQWISERVES